jgi:formylglycine-generating enzyme required for sulfatase activity
MGEVKKNNCSEFQENIYAFIDGELDSAEKQEFEKHLESCEICDAIFKESLEMEKEIKSLKEVTPSTDNAWDKFKQRLDEESMDLDIKLPEYSILERVLIHFREYSLGYGLACAACALFLMQGGPEVEPVMQQEKASMVSKSVVTVAKAKQEVEPEVEEPPIYQVRDSFELEKASLAKISTDGKTSEKFQKQKLPKALLPSFDGVKMALADLDAMIAIPGGVVNLDNKEVEVSKFEIDKFPVTNLEYERFVRATDRKAPFNWENGQYTHYDPKGMKPVTYVSWEDAKAFCKWESKDLATKEQWERAAKGDKDSKYPWGERFSKLFANTRESGIGIRPVGSYPANRSEFGVMELVGNVREWVQDDYTGPEVFVPGTLKVMKGGSYMDAAKASTVDSVFFGERDAIHGDTGIRCVR